MKECKDHCFSGSNYVMDFVVVVLVMNECMKYIWYWKGKIECNVSQNLEYQF